MQLKLTDYKVRDYAVTFEELKNSAAFTILNDFKEFLREKIGNVVEFGGRKLFYTEQFCFYANMDSQNFRVDFVYVRDCGDGYRNKLGEKIIRKPIKTKLKNFDFVWQHLMKLLPSNFKTLLNI